MGARDGGQIDRFAVLIVDAVPIPRIVSEAVLDTDDDPTSLPSPLEMTCVTTMQRCCDRTIDL